MINDNCNTIAFDIILPKQILFNDLPHGLLSYIFYNTGSAF